MSKKSFVIDKSMKLSKAINTYLPFFDDNRFKRALKDKNIKVNGIHATTNIQLNQGDELTIYYKEPQHQEHYNIIYEDDNLLVVDKYAGIETINDYGSSLYDELKLKYNELYAVHRLDTATTGLVMFAKNKPAEQELLSAIKNHTITKMYHAKLCNNPPKQHDILTAYLIKDDKNGIVHIFDDKKPKAVKIITEYKVISDRLAEITLHTGRTHQIRAQMAHIGCAVVGDGKYGKSKRSEKLQLRAMSLTFSFSPESVLSYLDGKTISLQ